MDFFEQLRRDEGERLVVYLDSKGIRSGGVGRNLEAHGIDWPVGTPIPQELSDSWLKEDGEKAKELVNSHLPWTATLDDARCGVLYNMCFNMGWGDGIKGLSGFHHMLDSVKEGNYSLAALGMMHSKWATDVGSAGPSEKHPHGQRAWRLAQQMETGVWT